MSTTQSEIRVNTFTAGTQEYSSVTALADGGWLVTWSSNGQDGAGDGVYQQRYAASGARVGGEIQVNSYTTGSQTEPSVTALADGGWLVTWTSYEQDGANYGVYQQRFNAEGQALGPTGPASLSLAAQPVSEGNSGSAGQLTVGAFDTSQGHTYTLLDDAGGRFAVTQRGTLVVNDGIKLDYEQATSHRVQVQVRDKATAVTLTQWVQISVTDVASENLTGSAAADALKGGRFSDTFRGSGGNDALYGGQGNDRLYGDTGKDALYAGSGNDRLYGGSGRDTFVFDTRTNKRTNVDKIYDFKSKDDSIYLDNAVFTKVGSGTETRPKKFKSDMFTEGKKAQDREDRIVYDKKTGALYYDKDGTGGSAQVKIATISNKTKLAYHDFFVI